MKKRSQSLVALWIALILVLISCRLLTPAPEPEPAVDVEQSVAQTVAAQLADQENDIQPLETPEPSAMMIDEDAAQPEGMGPCQLVFVSEHGGVWDLLALDFNTRQLWQLTSHGDVDTQVGFQSDPFSINVSVSPDGELIAFNSDEKVTHAVYVIHPDGSNRQSIGFNVSANDSWPTWSPDGDLLAFQSDRDGEIQVYIMDLAGELREHSIEANQEFIYPAWSPTGAHIAMVSGAEQDLYLHDIPSGQLNRLTQDVLDYGPPAWSPDGERLVVSADEGGLWNIYVVEVATGALTQLTEGTDVNRFPAWSPDGNWIAFSSEREGQAGIYLMPAQGGEAIRLTDHDRHDLAKAWLPGCAEELPGLLAGWDPEAPAVAGDPVPVFPGPADDPADPPGDDALDPPVDDPVDPPDDDPVDPPEGDPVDPPADDPVDPPEDDPVDPPQDDPLDPIEIDPVDLDDLDDLDEPEWRIGIPIIDELLEWIRQLGQRVGVIPIGEGEQVSTVWEDLLGLLGRPVDDPVVGGIGQEPTPIVTLEPTPTLEQDQEETEETRTPDESDDRYGPARFITEVDVGVEFDAVNCHGFTGEYTAVLIRSILGTSCSGVDDACGYQYALLDPFISVEINLPERTGSGACEGEFDCDWYSEPFDFSYTFVRRSYDCECDGFEWGGAVETWTFTYVNARLVIHAYTPGVSAWATIMAEEVIHSMTHSSPDVPDVVDVTREGVETEAFQILYGIAGERCMEQDLDYDWDDFPDLVPIVPQD